MSIPNLSLSVRFRDSLRLVGFLSRYAEGLHSVCYNSIELYHISLYDRDLKSSNISMNTAEDDCLKQPYNEATKPIVITYAKALNAERWTSVLDLTGLTLVYHHIRSKSNVTLMKSEAQVKISAVEIFSMRETNRFI